MDEDEAKTGGAWPPRVKHRVVEISLEECPFNRPGLKGAIGIGSMWELEFEDGHGETMYEDGKENATP
jgi:hypothetical protein